MMTTESAGKSRLTSAPLLLITAVFLLMAIGGGYLVRESRTRKSSSALTPNVGMPSNVSPAPARTPETVVPQETPEQLKQMADQQAQPILAKLKASPTDPALLVQLGDLRYDAGQYKQAISYYEQSLALDPNNTRVRADMASAYAYSGDYDRAIAEYKTALKYDPKHALSLYNLGMVLWRDKGDTKDAVEAWETLLRANPQFAQQMQVSKLVEQAKQHAHMAPPGQTGK